MSEERIPVVVNGLPGKMATETARAIDTSPDFSLHNYALTGNLGNSCSVEIGAIEVHLYASPRKKIFSERSSCRGKFAVDYTAPGAAVDNAAFYVEQNMPFVMGTTSFSRSDLDRIMEKANVPAVVAPNMALPIVAFQRFMQSYSQKHIDVLYGCGLNLTESHQSAKKDTSGTAKSMIENNGSPGYFTQLGINFGVSQIVKVRTRDEQIIFGVPEENLEWHAYHRYEISDGTDSMRLPDLYVALETFLKTPVFSGYSWETGKEGKTFKLDRISKDRTNGFGIEFSPTGSDSKTRLAARHWSNGGKVYADGTMEALRFLRAVETDGRHNKTYSMIDVLDFVEKTV